MDILIVFFILTMIVVLISKAASKKPKDSGPQQTTQLEFNCKRCSPNNDLIRIDSKGNYYVAHLKNSKFNKTITIKKQYIFELEKSVEAIFEEWMEEEIALDTPQPSCVKDTTTDHMVCQELNSESDDTIGFRIAGIYYRTREEIERVRQLHEGDKVYLIKEPTNIFDANAIKVMTLDNYHIGYVPRTVNEEVGNIMGGNKRLAFVDLVIYNPDAPYVNVYIKK